MQLHDRLDDFIKRENLTRKELSARIGQGEKYISNLLNRKNDPGHAVVLKICQVLNTTPNALSGLDDSLSISGTGSHAMAVSRLASTLVDQATNEARAALDVGIKPPSIDDLLNWWYSHQGRLEGTEAIRSSIAIFNAPTSHSEFIDPVTLGENSLAAKSFNTTNTDELRRIISNFSPKMNQRLLISQRDTAKGQPLLTIEEIDVGIPHLRKRIRFHYKRLLLPVFNNSGDPLILNFSQFIR